MVGVPGRSRGCATCRKRRVKCDETFPECLRCLNMGKRCPGARTEAFFVHAVSDVPSCQPPDNPTKSLVPCLRLPRSPPCPASAFDQLFVAHFIDSFFGPTKPPPAAGIPSKIWLHELPVFLTSPEPSSAKHAIRATSMLSYGSITDDIAIKTAARKWYTKALQDLQCLLSRGKLSLLESSLCAIVMLIHFETWAGTSHRAWLQHVKGAALLLEAGGPELCRSGFMHQIFSHIRLQMLVAAMTQNEETAFASAEWMAIPFEVHPKMIFDQLIDILFAVQKCLLVANKLIRTVDEDATELMTDLDELIQDAMLQIHGWWIGFISSGGFRDATGKKTFGFETNPDLWCGLKEPLLPYTNIPEAALSSLYDAANVIILRLLHLVSASAAFYNLRVQNHAQSILSANHFINATSGPAPDRGSTMMVLQLKVASLWSSSSKQRDMAIAMLHGEKVQAGGLSDISSPSDEYFADVAAHILLHYPSE